MDIKGESTGYFCSCNDGWTGPRCEQMVLSAQSYSEDYANNLLPYGMLVVMSVGIVMIILIIIVTIILIRRMRKLELRQSGKLCTNWSFDALMNNCTK